MLLESLGKTGTSVPIIMREADAQTDPNTQIKESCNDKCFDACTPPQIRHPRAGGDPSAMAVVNRRPCSGYGWRRPVVNERRFGCFCGCP
jgi:hypothetical protein